jgi:rSAM/selenodomain-associated transferase 2/rSAM/selenodomain-associated transferase 1
VLLTRFPRLGEVKTRLVPPLTAEEAVALHDRLSRQALRTARALVATGEARVEVRTDAAYALAGRDWLGARDVGYRYQGDGDLGARLFFAFAEGFRGGTKRVAVIGSDCPRLTTEHLRDALRRLAGVDVVLGPAADGGYYLVAIRREAHAVALNTLFVDVEWGSAQVLDQTVAICEANGLSYAFLGELPDVDRAEDLADAEAALDARVLRDDARVSVVMPVLDDAPLVGAAVRSALDGGAIEVIAVDGGSRDATPEAAAAAGARVVESGPGRARQMNAGAAEAVGEIVLFQHADTLVPAGAAQLAREALSGEGVVAGAFGFAVPTRSRHAGTIDRVGQWRSRLTGHPLGDQCLFLSAGTFHELGGFPELPTMEDWEFVRRLKRLGEVVQLPEPAVTSARVWDEHGLVWPTAVNSAVIIGYRLGIDPEMLADWRQRIAPASRKQTGNG